MGGYVRRYVRGVGVCEVCGGGGMSGGMSGVLVCVRCVCVGGGGVCQEVCQGCWCVRCVGVCQEVCQEVLVCV